MFLQREGLSIQPDWEMSLLEQTITFPWNIYKKSFQKNRQVCGGRLAISERPLVSPQRRAGGRAAPRPLALPPAVGLRMAGDQSRHRERSPTLLIKAFRRVWEWHTLLATQRGAGFPSSGSWWQKDTFTSGRKKHSGKENISRADQDGKSWNMINIILLFVKIMDPGGNFDLWQHQTTSLPCRCGKSSRASGIQICSFPHNYQCLCAIRIGGFRPGNNPCSYFCHEKTSTTVQRRQSCSCLAEGRPTPEIRLKAGDRYSGLAKCIHSLTPSDKCEFVCRSWMDQWRLQREATRKLHNS